MFGFCGCLFGGILLVFFLVGVFFLDLSVGREKN
jgi:hypothetical protein